MHLLTSAQMREADRRTIEEMGLPGIVLMENAGAGATALLQARLPEWKQRPILILAGCGNNGGDGFVMARRLLQAGGKVTVLLFGLSESLRGDARIHYQVFFNLGGKVHEITDPETQCHTLDPLLTQCGVVVDAIFGTGLTRPVTGLIADALRKVAQSGLPVLAVDLPSGVCADTGQVLGYALPANWTVTFATEKIGHRSHPGAALCGEITVIDIGIPHTLIEIPQHTVFLNQIDDLVIPTRALDAHKGDCGRLLILAGSPGMEGAAILTAQGALRTGPGLITVATPVYCQPVITSGVVEAMTLALSMDKPALQSILASRFHPQVIAMGPGLGVTPWSRALVDDILNHFDLPMVLDADALNILADQRESLTQRTKNRHSPLIFTPHPGEMARLLGITIQDLQKDRLNSARNSATTWGVWVVLKGALTVIAAPNGRVWINPTGNPGMAAGGSGDLLTGIIAGFLAQGWTTESAVRMGVWLHGAAGDAAAQSLGMVGMVASDLLPFIHRLRNQ
ncbi:MAG: NAD(P)H-hydrate dehydratase [Magnetococcales bacterium]|nr:NAD(P)H-hydrate dehydratase [Magnetococcales bacterium]MBF0437795.1 NAD(P)H-hydrate dehydratase [Magnetococcales bacterium]